MDGKSYLDHLDDPPPRRQGQSDNGRELTSAGGRMVVMLDLRLADGNRIALPYSSLMRVEFNPSTGIRLHYPGDLVEITGRRLGKVYRAISQHRARRVGVSRDGESRKEGGPVITGIRWSQARA